MATGNNRSGAPRRLYSLAAILFLWVITICGRLAWLQVVRYSDFAQRAARQQQRTIDVEPSRGIIFDRKGRELAMSVSVDSVFAVPSEIPDQQTTARILGRVLGADDSEILARMKSSRSFCWVARKIDPDKSQRIHALNLKGIYFQKESKRFYPKNELAAQVLGYVGLDDGGLAGIERAFDSRLRGKPGKMLISLDARRKGFGRVERDPVPGENLVLTIDEKIQYIVERELSQAITDTHAQAATVIVSNPATGEILALANRPSFNPNHFRFRDVSALKNRAVSDVYEPGSTFKLVTISGTLEENLVSPDDLVDCQMGSIVIAGVRIHDHRPFGQLTVSQVLEKSSDVGAIKLGLRLGPERFDYYIRNFGFGKQTGLELPGETRGLTKPLERWSKISIGAMAMGQEIGVSPVQLISMVNTIANDGLYTAPRIVAGSANHQLPGQTVVFHPAEQRRVISSMTAAKMKKMMEMVVLFGTGRKAILNGYSSAGKTGTAQKVDPGTGAYSRSHYVASFIGFAPIASPAVTVAVILDSPVGMHEGGEVAAPVFARITQQVLEYMNTPHDIEIRNDPRLRLQARAQLSTVARPSKAELAEGSPDHPGDALGLAEGVADTAVAGIAGERAESLPARRADHSVPAELLNAKLDVQDRVAHSPAGVKAEEKTSLAAAAASPEATLQGGERETIRAAAAAEAPPPRTGTVVLDLEQKKITPPLLGKSVRDAIEAAEEAGLEIDVMGSGIARAQNPPAGTPISSSTHIAVKFGR